MKSSNNHPIMKKTSSFLLNKPPNNYNSTELLPSSPLPKIEYPSQYPQIILGGESPRHSSHPQHPLSLVDVSKPFTCSGCKEYGSGFRFSCQQCEFQLHEFCALAPSVLKAHHFHVQHQLSLYSKPGGTTKSKCDVCWMPAKGYTFRCDSCNYQMHPCCAILSDQINTSVHPHPLKILTVNTINSPDGDPSSGFACGECQKKRSGQVYRCTVCEYHLHAICAKKMFNGLQANGIKVPEKKLRAVAKLVTQVAKKLIGGIFEGVGKEVGEMFVQSITRGRGPAAATNYLN